MFFPTKGVARTLNSVRLLIIPIWPDEINEVRAHTKKVYSLVL